MHPMTSLKHGKSMSKATTDIQSMTGKDRRIMVQGLLQAIINSGAPPARWEKHTREAVRVMLRTLRSIDPNEKGKKNGN